MDDEEELAGPAAAWRRRLEDEYRLDQERKAWERFLTAWRDRQRADGKREG